jgi:endonuclease YncB( thermonuclease family)
MHRMLLCIAVMITACRSDSMPALSQSTTASALAINATMVSVVDGDTIDVNIKGHRERVRLIGIDTPETKKPNTPVQCYGPEATKFTKSLLPSDMPLHHFISSVMSLPGTTTDECWRTSTPQWTASSST